MKKSTAAAKKTASTKKETVTIGLTKAPVTPTVIPPVDFKSAAANDGPEKSAQPTAATPTASTKKEKAAPKPKEEFLVKLRSKGDLLAALKAGGILYLENGLWRLDPGREDKKVHRVSKRRAVAFRAAELILPTTKDTRGHDNAFTLNLAKAAEAETPKKPASAPAPAGKVVQK
jgi:hypothetical protein